MAPRASVTAARQLTFPDLSPVPDAVKALATAGIEERGAIFTRKEVVDFILDLAGYTTDRPLHELRLLEPSFGDGDFLLPAVERLMESAKRLDVPAREICRLLSGAICGVELHAVTFAKTRTALICRLRTSGLAAAQAEELAGSWLRQGDFLLQEFGQEFDIVVGNPPYVRQELIPDVLMAEYRARYSTIYDRADIYIPFIEHSLGQLTKGGVLGFICADRWMKNRYGGPLRKLVAGSYHLRTFVDMVDTPAFHSEVIAYPAITIIAREKGKNTRVARRPETCHRPLSAFSRVQGIPRRFLSAALQNSLSAPDEGAALFRSFGHHLATHGVGGRHLCGAGRDDQPQDLCDRARCLHRSRGCTPVIGCRLPAPARSPLPIAIPFL